MNLLNRTVDAGRSCLLALALLVSPFASADPDYSHWYIGADVGASRATIDDDRIAASLLASGLTADSIVDDDSNMGYKLLLGYRFNRFLAIEGGYFDLGSFGFTASTTPAGTLTGSLDLKGYDLDLVGYVPFGDDHVWSVFGRIGYTSVDASSTFAGTGAVVVPTPTLGATEGNYKAGLGLQLDLTKSFGARLELERYRVDDTLGNEGDIDVLSLGLVYRFGMGEDRVAAVAPAPVEEVVVVPVVAKTERYCTILDIQFEINGEDMQREETERLGVVGLFLRDYPGTTAVIQGHTDSVGSDADNQALSLRRAQSVVDYLVDDQRIARSRLSAIGYGEKYPIADNGTREGQQANRRIGAVIACATDLAGLKPAKARVTMALEIEFDPYQFKVQPESREPLRKLADFLKANPYASASVEGHSDKYLGEGKDRVAIDPKVSMEVSMKRAQAVVDYLATEFGISRSRLGAEGFGQTRRVSYGTTLEGQQENRRINVIINYPNQNTATVGAR